MLAAGRGVPSVRCGGRRARAGVVMACAVQSGPSPACAGWTPSVAVTVLVNSRADRRFSGPAQVMASCDAWFTEHFIVNISSCLSPMEKGIWQRPGHQERCGVAGGQGSVCEAGGGPGGGGGGALRASGLCVLVICCCINELPQNDVASMNICSFSF